MNNEPIPQSAPSETVAQEPPHPSPETSWGPLCAAVGIASFVAFGVAIAIPTRGFLDFTPIIVAMVGLGVVSAGLFASLAPGRADRAARIAMSMVFGFIVPFVWLAAIVAITLLCHR